MAGRSDIIPAFLMFLAMLCYAKYRAKEGCGLAGPSPGSGNIKGSDQALLGDATGSGGPPTARLPDGQGEAGFGEVTEPDRPPDKIGTERTETHIGGAGRFYFLFLSSLSLFLALLSKEVAISLLALLPLYDHLAQRTALVKGTEPPKVRFILYLLPLLAFLSYFMMRRAALGSSTGSTHWRDRGDENLFLDSLSIVGFYLKKLLWPFDLQAFIPEIPNSNSHLFLSLLLLFSSVLLFAWAYWKHRPVIAFSIAWVFVTLSPSILVAFTTVSKTPLAERYLYIPSFGFTLITGLLLMNLLESPPLQKGILRSLKPAIGLLLIGTILGTGAWTTLNRNRVWNNSIAFWSDLIQKTPEYGLPHNNLGNAYMVTGRMDEAMEEFKLALQLKYEKFGKSMASTALGAVFMFRGEYDQAEQAFLSAIRLKQTNYYPYYYLGILYIDRTDTMTNHGEQRNETLQKAVVNLKKSIELNPFFPAAYYDLGRAYRRLGDEGEAIKHLKRVLEMTTDPSSEIVLKAKRLLSSLTESKPSP
jgi:tetratricopeptide (TPR) repeat protein